MQKSATWASKQRLLRNKYNIIIVKLIEEEELLKKLEELSKKLEELSQ